MGMHAAGLSQTTQVLALVCCSRPGQLCFTWHHSRVRLGPSSSTGLVQGQPADIKREGQQSVVFRTTHRVAFGEKIKVCSCTNRCQALGLRSKQPWVPS